MNKSELIEALATRLEGDRKAAANALEALIEEITRALVKGERVAITGFGTFEKRERAARVGRNPRTGEKVKVKKSSAPAFKAGATLKSHVSGATKLPKVPATKSVAAVKKASPVAAPAKKAAAKTAAKAPARKTVAAKTTAPKTAIKAPAKKVVAKKAPARKAAR